MVTFRATAHPIWLLPALDPSAGSTQRRKRLDSAEVLGRSGRNLLHFTLKDTSGGKRRVPDAAGGDARNH